MQLHIANISSVRIGGLYLICETSQHRCDRCDETKQTAQWRYQTRTQENHKQNRDGPTTDIHNQ